MKIVAVGTLKGGTGKTTVLFNIAGILATTKKVLLLDVDPQCNLSAACGVKITKKNRLSSRDIFRDDVEVTPDQLTVKSPIKELPNLDIIPSHMLMTAVEFFMVNRSAREWVLENYIEENKGFFEQYDYILIDTNPSMGIVNQNAFTVADSIVLVTDISEDGIAGAELFCYLWEGIRKALRKPDNVKALVINNGDRRISLTKELKEYCEDNEDLLSLLVSDMIYGKAIYKDARIFHQPVNIMPKGKQAAKDVAAVVKGLKKKGVF